MKLARISLFALALATAVAASAWAEDKSARPDVDQSFESVTDDCCQIDEPCCCDKSCRSFYAYSDALWLQLDQDNDRIITTNQVTQATRIAMSDLDFDMEAGPRLTIGVLEECSGYEVSYFGFHDWNDTVLAVGNNNLRLAGDLALASDDFFGADAMQVNYSAELHNLEFNLLNPSPGSDTTLLMGFRYLNFQEDIDIRSLDSDASISDYRVGAENNLFGAQVGARRKKHRGIFEAELVGKAGIYGNAAQQRNLALDLGNTFTLRDEESERGNVAFVGEMGINGAVLLGGGWHVRTGYNLLFVDGVARAAEQVDLTDTATSGTRLSLGDAFLHGVNVGLEGRW